MDYPSILKTISVRKSIRKYLDKPVEDEKIHLILESARLAPSSCNSQPWFFYAVKNKDKIIELSKSKNSPLKINLVTHWMANAPLVIVACANPDLFSHKAAGLFAKDCHEIDVAIALEHMVLTAVELGLGSCWIGWFNEKKVKQVLDIPRKLEVVAILTIGYPSETPKEKLRKSVEEITTFVL